MTYGSLSNLIYADSAFNFFVFSLLTFYIYYIRKLLFFQILNPSIFHLLHLLHRGSKTTGRMGRMGFSPMSLECYLYGCPARIRTEVLAFRGLPVLETGVLTATPRGDILLTNYFLININPIHLNDGFVGIHLIVLHCFIKNRRD